jgi:CRISPR-associated protein Cmr5
MSDNQPISQRQTTEQRRAAAAWKAIEEVDRLPAAQAKYGTIARRFPALVQINGLGATLAFIQAKAKNDQRTGHGLLYKHLSNWLLDYLNWTAENNEGIMHLVRNAPVNMYRRATVEAIEYGIWLKRYVEAKDWGSAEGDDDG